MLYFFVLVIKIMYKHGKHHHKEMFMMLATDLATFYINPISGPMIDRNIAIYIITMCSTC